MINQLTFTKHYDTFDNVSKIYSDKFPQGKDLDLLHIVLYFRFLSYQENNLNCYESHETLAKIFKSSASTIKRKINDLKEMGLLETSPHPDPYISSLIYNALPLTDAHITAPREAKASVNAEKPQTEQVSTVKAVPEQLPPTEDKKTLETTRSIQQEKTELPWGGVTICKPNGQPTEAALEWALAETQGDNIEAYRLISIMVSEFTGREHIYTIPETEEDDFDIPF
ncbi:hypothetical protein V7J50_13555 [Escherichia coli]|uniref:hypothetical protein n=1 Tax=Escherichia TaxID=561 RepID=UPI00136176E7|nr:MULTISPECIES: hypothetical protein [Escherichia]MCB2261268.1 helix-turn-helix domain-containing protein [Escherichia albertii]MCB2269037.1 helix-turn-helix domain-containing protein [Escherichia albertii]MCB2273646.1 helix-turn-helix domain-containing protein [Escherichia albertii]MCG0060508.1 helix-turn-helix domain-containing protein [Escherichia coli]NAR25835.1 hypothetical protein [Escherichia coli]